MIFCPALLNWCKIPASFGRGRELTGCEDESMLMVVKLTRMAQIKQRRREIQGREIEVAILGLGQMLFETDCTAHDMMDETWNADELVLMSQKMTLNTLGKCAHRASPARFSEGTPIVEASRVDSAQREQEREYHTGSRRGRRG